MTHNQWQKTLTPTLWCDLAVRPEERVRAKEKTFGAVSSELSLWVQYLHLKLVILQAWQSSLRPATVNGCMLRTKGLPTVVCRYF